MSRPAGTSPERGQLYTVEIEGTRIDRAVVLTENDWNAITHDCVIVPFFRDAEAQETIFRPRLDHELVADCTAPGSLPQHRLGRYLGDCPADVLRALTTGVRTYFGIDGLLDPPRMRRRVAGPGRWWPKQSEVHQALRIAPAPKWVAIVSEDESNAALAHAAAVRITSTDTTKPWRKRWEVPLRAGYASPGDLFAIPHSAFEPRPPLSPPFARLTGDEMRALAERLVETLEL